MELLNAEAWRRDALCAEPHYQDVPWFPEIGENANEAKDVCWRCLAREDCLSYALALGIDSGVRGGTSPAERRRLRRPAA